MLEEIGGLLEQIDRYKTIGEPPDHLVAAPPDRGQIPEVVEHGERIDRRQRVALPGQEQAVEGAGGLLLDAACHVRVRVYRHGRVTYLDRVSGAAIFRLGSSR